MAEMNRRWLLAARPHGMVKDSDFSLVEAPVPEPGPGEFLVRVTHLSFDPTQRGWITADTYLPAVKIGDVVRAGGVGQVVKSNHPGFKVGQMVQGGFGWQDYYVSAGMTEFMPVSIVHPGISPEQALGVFGITGLTAYFGLTDVGKPNPGDTVLVSGAAGATGSVVIQIAKALGCRAIGIAGGADKCAWVTGVAGADACIDYKNENVARRIRELAPNGVNVVFENVGGEMLEAALMNLAQRARVVLCGGISSYNEVEPKGIRPYMQLTVTRSRMEGFIVLDYAPRYPEGVMALSKLIAEGKLKTADDVQNGFENIPATLRRLFEGKNLGKQLLKITEPPLPIA
ncbi:MAG: NADP-dependent oxidoreductase [Caulobacterales bacterium]